MVAPRSQLFLVLLVLVATFWASACSLYQSDGRKFLQNNLETIGVSVQANFHGCNHDFPRENWRLIEKRPDALVFGSDKEDYLLRVVPNEDEAFSCYYEFNSAQEMYEKVPAACDHTINELTATPPKTRAEN